MDALVSKKGHLIHKLRATDTTGRPAYYFALIEPQKEMMFNKALKDVGNTLDFEDYGKVIASCYGNEPNAEVKEFLKDKYGFDV